MNKLIVEVIMFAVCVMAVFEFVIIQNIVDYNVKHPKFQTWHCVGYDNKPVMGFDHARECKLITVREIE